MFVKPVQSINPYSGGENEVTVSPQLTKKGKPRKPRGKPKLNPQPKENGQKPAKARRSRNEPKQNIEIDEIFSANVKVNPNPKPKPEIRRKQKDNSTQKDAQPKLKNAISKPKDTKPKQENTIAQQSGAKQRKKKENITSKMTVVQKNKSLNKKITASSDFFVGQSMLSDTPDSAKKDNTNLEISNICSKKEQSSESASVLNMPLFPTMHDTQMDVHKIGSAGDVNMGSNDNAILQWNLVQLCGVDNPNLNITAGTSIEEPFENGEEWQNTTFDLNRVLQEQIVTDTNGMCADELMRFLDSQDFFDSAAALDSDMLQENILPYEPVTILKEEEFSDSINSNDKSVLVEALDNSTTNTSITTTTTNFCPTSSERGCTTECNEYFNERDNNNMNINPNLLTMVEHLNASLSQGTWKGKADLSTTTLPNCILENQVISEDMKPQEDSRKRCLASPHINIEGDDYSSLERRIKERKLDNELVC